MTDKVHCLQEQLKKLTEAKILADTELKGLRQSSIGVMALQIASLERKHQMVLAQKQQEIDNITSQLRYQDYSLDQGTQTDFVNVIGLYQPAQIGITCGQQTPME